MKQRSDFKVVNHSVPRSDGVAKVTGTAVFTSDMALMHMVWAKVLRSPYAHARIASIDTAAALKRPGVLAVLTGDALAGLHPYYGHAVKDHPLLAIGKVRFVGEPVAAVIAEDELSAQEALDDLFVEYEELTAILSVDAALAPGAAAIHDQDYRAGNFRGFNDQSLESKGNICQEVHIAWGDVETAFASAAHVVEGEFYFPMVYAYAMEPYVALADYDGRGQLTVYSSAQHPFMVRQDLADVSDCR